MVERLRSSISPNEAIVKVKRYFEDCDDSAKALNLVVPIWSFLQHAGVGASELAGLVHHLLLLFFRQFRKRSFCDCSVNQYIEDESSTESEHLCVDRRPRPKSFHRAASNGCLVCGWRFVRPVRRWPGEYLDVLWARALLPYSEFTAVFEFLSLTCI
jgi:hypothetical protein